MSSAIPGTPNPVSASQHAVAQSTPPIANGTTSSLSGAVPAQLPARSYATATKTATPTYPAGASAPAHNAKPASDNSPMNGTAAQGGSQPANGMNGHASDHTRKTSVVISASGASGSYPNGGPVQNGNSRPAINFGSMGAPAESQGSASFAPNNASLPTPATNPRVTSPAHSPSPIPQPAASGGRPPSINATNNGGLNFGAMPADTEMMRGQGNMGPVPAHERRPSSHSMQNEHSNQGVNMSRPPFPSSGGSGRGRGAFNPGQQPFMGSPSAGYRQMAGQPPRGPMPPQFGQQGGPPGSPFRGAAGAARMSPAPMHAQPHYQQQHMAANQQMQYGGYPQHMNYQQQVGQHLNAPTMVSTSDSRSVSVGRVRGPPLSYKDKDSPLLQSALSSTAKFPFAKLSPSISIMQPILTTEQQQAMYGMPSFDPSQGYYQPYYPQNHYGQPPQSPRPGFPTPFTMPPHAQQPPFNPPGTPGAADMNRTGSQTSNRPTSAIGHPQTPAQNPAAPSHTPNASQGSAFQRPKKSSAIKITDASGNAIDFKKSAPSPNPQAQSGAPVIVSTPSNPTPPPRAPSTQHNRTESKSQQDPEKTKNEFVERVKRQAEETKRKEAEAEAEKAKSEKDASDAKAKERAHQEEAAHNEIKKATAEAEEAAAKAASDKRAVDDAAAAKKAAEDDEAEKTRRQQEEDERLEREIAEMEAAEKEEEERERAYAEKKAKQKAEQAAKDAERAKEADEELKRQEREAEAREEARERERQGGAATDADEEKKALFAQLNRHPELGSAPPSGADTPASEDTAAEESEASTAAPTRAAGAQKPKPAHLKLETNKQVERAEPTPGMQALKSARFLELKEDAKYPDGFKSPNPALNQSRQKGTAYDKDFLLQFQNVFKEKPSVDWDQKVKETLGPSDEPGSARSGTPRTASGAMSRGGSNRPGAGGPFAGGAMGNFAGPMGGNARGTTSEQRFAMSNQMGGPPRPGGMAPPMGGRQPSNLGMGAPSAMMSRTNSSFNMAGGIGPGSPRNPSARGGKGSSKRENPSRRQEADMASKMPLTANKELVPLEKSSSGWKPTSIGQASSAGPDPSGHMAPDMVQRKVKAALNKMTPEKFDKIADQILEIAAQSKTEADGRTLRQVIQLTFEKACDEAHWAGMYAKFCHKMLTTMSTDIRDETIKDKNGNPVVGGALFRKYLLNRCQEEFERGWQANLPDKPEGEEEAALLTDDYYIAAAAKRRGLGLIQFIGQLYKLRMLTLRIMHECVLRLLNFEGDPDEATVENLTTLLKAVGASMEEEEQGRSLMATYFQRIEDSIVKSDALGSRPKFMVMDLIDLRKAGWKGKDSDKGPKTIQQIHEEAEAAQAKAELERQKTQRGGRGGPMPSGRGDARNFSGGMPPPQDYSRTNVNMDDLRRLQNRGSNPRPTGGSLGPGGGLGPSALSSGRTGSRRGAAGLGPGSTGTSRTNTPPVDKKDEPSTAQNAFSALAALDSSGEAPEETPASPPTARTEPAAQDDDAHA